MPSGSAEVVAASYVNEGEGDYLRARVVLGGSGFRTDPRSHDEVADFLGVPVVSLELVDERFYHLDTALAVLTDDLVAYWPGAFSRRSVGVIEDLFPDAIVATEADAVAFGLNAWSDGRTVVVADGAHRAHRRAARPGLPAGPGRHLRAADAPAARSSAAHWSCHADRDHERAGGRARAALVGGQLPPAARDARRG